MGFVLFRRRPSTHEVVPISTSKADQLIQAHTSLSSLLDIEEVWDCLVNNYFDLELDVITVALGRMISLGQDFSSYHKTRLGHARRLSNLLSSARSYLDHTPQHLRKIAISDYDLSADFVCKTREVYDGNFDYRLMEALRNHAQHGGLPLHGTSFQGRRVAGELGSSLSFKSSASIDIVELRKSAKFKASILAELEGVTEAIDVISAVRGYMENLSKIHESLKAASDDMILKWSDVITDAVGYYETKTDSRCDGLFIMDTDAEIQTSDYYFSGTVAERIRSLRSTNSSLVNLKKRFVTNQI